MNAQEATEWCMMWRTIHIDSDVIHAQPTIYKWKYYIGQNCMCIRTRLLMISFRLNLALVGTLINTFSCDPAFHFYYNKTCCTDTAFWLTDSFASPHSYVRLHSEATHPITVKRFAKHVTVTVTT